MTMRAMSTTLWRLLRDPIILVYARYFPPPLWCHPPPHHLTKIRCFITLLTQSEAIYRCSEFQAQEVEQQARCMYEEISDELCTTLPALHDYRIEFISSNFHKFFSSQYEYHHTNAEVSELLCHKLLLTAPYVISIVIPFSPPLALRPCLSAPRFPPLSLPSSLSHTRTPLSLHRHHLILNNTQTELVEIEIIYLVKCVNDICYWSHEIIVS